MGISNTTSGVRWFKSVTLIIVVLAVPILLSVL